MLDASVALCWCFADQIHPYAEAVQAAIGAGASPLAAFVWPLEIGQALVRAERASKLTAAAVQAWVASFSDPPIRIDRAGLDQAFGPVLALARHTGLSTYDAAYLELAVRARLPLATLDADLKKAARRQGIALFAPA